MIAAPAAVERDAERVARAAAERVRARQSLSAFVRRMFPGYTGGRHLTDLCAALERCASTPNGRLIVTMPPRHSKSLHVSEHLPAWYLGRFPDKRVIAAAHTASLAYTFSRRVRNKLADPRWPFPGVRVADDKGAVSAWDLADRRGGYVAVGVGGTPVGMGCDLLVIDDPVRSAADADSETVRDALWEWYQGTIRTRLEPGASVVVTATRWSEDDLTGRLLAAQEAGGERWEHLHLPAVSDAGDPLWPERWPLSELDRTRAAVGSRTWEAQYQGRPSPAEGGMFKRHWWRSYEALPALRRAEILVDSAFKDGVANDWSVFALWGSDGLTGSYLVRVWRERVQFPELIQLGHAAHAWASDRFPALRVPLVVEDKASGQSAIQVWSRPYHTRDGVLPALPVVRFPAETNKTARAEGVTPEVEGGRVFVPAAAPWLGAWVEEHAAFPAGAHDDQVDTTSMALTRLRGRRVRKVGVE